MKSILDTTFEVLTSFKLLNVDGMSLSALKMKWMQPEVTVVFICREPKQTPRFSMF